MKVATNWADLIDGVTLQPIEVDEQGGHPGVFRGVWTSTLADGTPSLTGDNCLEWSSMAIADSSVIGISTSGSQSWTESTLSPCDKDLHLYCFEQ